MRSIRVVKSVPCYTYVQFIEWDSGVPPRREGVPGVVKKRGAMTNRWTPSFSRAFIVEHTSPCFMACHTRNRDKRDPGGSDAPSSSRARFRPCGRIIVRRGGKKKRKHDAKKDRPACTRLISPPHAFFLPCRPKWARLPSRHPAGRRLILFTRLFFAC